VRVISKRRLVEFWEEGPGDGGTTQRDLSTWYKLAERADWGHFAALRQTFGSADQVGNCVVFDVGNNRLRVIGRVNYSAGILYILKVMDHKEYDRNRWVDDCGCDRPPPGRTAASRSRPKKGR
jgi:mRNA interferase HigB